MTNLPVLALSLLTLAGAPKSSAPKATPGPRCEDQCTLIDNSCGDSCKQVPSKGQGQAMCKRNCTEISKACVGSCREKGRIDEDYIKKHISLPTGAKPGDLDREVDDGDHE